MLRLVTAGESHGPAVVATLDGLPAGIPVTQAALDHQLARRQAGYGRGRRMQIEQDQAEVLGGIRFGRSLGSPVAILIRNRDHANWQEQMAVWGEPPVSYQPVTCPRPGHADLAGLIKYAAGDVRDILERASARETAARVAAGALARRLLEEIGIGLCSQVTAVGGAAADPGALNWPQGDIAAYLAWQAAVDRSPLRCSCPAASREMVRAIDQASAHGYSLGGTFEVRSSPLPPGLGTHTQWDRRLDAALGAALLSIQGIKALAIGDALGQSTVPGSRAHDAIALEDGRLVRTTNRAGGLEGGISNGEPLVVTCYMKPIATQRQPLDTVDLATWLPAAAARERADVCAVPAAAVVAEAMVAITLASAVLVKFGGDSLTEVRRNLRGYLAACSARLSGPEPGASP